LHFALGSKMLVDSPAGPNPIIPMFLFIILNAIVRISY